MEIMNTKSLHQYAARCRTPRQFRALLTKLRSVIPYSGMACKWGNARTAVVTNILDIDFPRAWLGWYLATGMTRRDPVFDKAAATRRPQMILDVLQQDRSQSHTELIEKVKKYNLQNGFYGSQIDGERMTCFYLVFTSEQQAMKYLNAFTELQDAFAAALLRSYPRPVLTERKKIILQERAYGKMPHEIAKELSISTRTVKMHIEEIKRKLYAVDIVNAVWIGGQTGLIG